MIPWNQWQQIKKFVKRSNPGISFDDFDEDWKRERYMVSAGIICPQCRKILKNLHGLDTHRGKVHKGLIKDFKNRLFTRL